MVALLFRQGCKIYRAPDTDICLNCPLAECVTTDQSPIDIRRRPVEPECPRDFATYHSIDLEDAENLASQTLARGMGDRAYRSAVRQVADRRKMYKKMKG